MFHEKTGSIYNWQNHMEFVNSRVLLSIRSHKYKNFIWLFRK